MRRGELARRLFEATCVRPNGLTVGPRGSATGQGNAANYALVEWSANIAISDEPPAAYWPQCAARLGKPQLAQMRFWHALPKGWQNMEYATFLDQRRRLMAQVIKTGFEALVQSSAHSQ